jgi:large subunit ribosomal protein L31
LPDYLTNVLNQTIFLSVTETFIVFSSFFNKENYQYQNSLKSCHFFQFILNEKIGIFRFANLFYCLTFANLKITWRLYKRKPCLKQNNMKKDIHPSNYRFVVFRDMSNGTMFLSRSTAASKETVQWEDGKEYPVIKLEISNTSHPFYTGKNMLVDTAGRIDKFRKRYEKKK